MKRASIILLLTAAALLLQLPPSAGWLAQFQPSAIELKMDKSAQVLLELADIEPEQLAQPQRFSFQLRSNAARLASVASSNETISMALINSTTRSFRGQIVIDAHYLGESLITVRLIDAQDNSSSAPSKDSGLAVAVVRPERVVDHVFIGSVILLMSLLYINFGAALDLSVLRSLLARPVGPCLGFVMQCIGMPLLSYALGVFIFPNAPAMQLGLFFTGIAPSGGASNTWSAVLGGNIHLSVLMTTVSNVAAFATMPMWIFTLGQLIFERAGMEVPYGKIATSAVGLVVPLLIGLGIQRWSPRLTRVLVRLLKPISLCLILFIIVFAIVTNFYLFELFSWQIAVAGLALPGLGYTFTWLAAKLLHQNAADALTIAIETGIQNTGIAIFFLRTTLKEPQGDLTTVVPVSVAIMTPLPLLGIYLYKRCSGAKITDAAAATGSGEQQRIV